MHQEGLTKPYLGQFTSVTKKVTKTGGGARAHTMGTDSTLPAYISCTCSD
jgi:hypothetical protein